MLSKIGWGIVAAAVLALIGVAFFQKYQIVARPAPAAGIPTVENIPTTSPATDEAPAVTADIAETDPIQLTSADISEETTTYTIKAFYPAMNGGKEAVRNGFNNGVKAVMETLAATFKQATVAGGVSSSSKSFFTGAYDIKEHNDDLLSALLSVEQYIANAAHPSHPIAAYNYNLKTGQAITLSDLFVPGAKYLEALSNYCQKELIARNVKEKFSNKAAIQAGTAPKEEMFNVWNITADGLLITFPEYQVAPYVAGARTTVVPWNELKGIIDTKSAVSGYLSVEQASADEALAS